MILIHDYLKQNYAKQLSQLHLASW
jgi:hypothetical protein